MDAGWIVWPALGGVCGLGASRVAGRLSEGAAGRPAWAVAVVNAALMVWAMAATGGGWPHLALALLLSGVLLALTLVDLATLRLPNVLTLPLILAGLALALAERTDLLDRLAGAVVGYGTLAGLAFCFRRLRGRDGIGLGDAKLLAGAGAWLGWRPLPALVLLACVLAFAWVGLRFLRRGASSLRSSLPFGPHLAAAFWLVWLLGPLLDSGSMPLIGAPG